MGDNVTIDEWDLRDLQNIETRLDEVIRGVKQHVMVADPIAIEDVLHDLVYIRTGRK